jgi:signal transduction histidine kinase
MTGELTLERRRTDLVAVLRAAVEGIQPAARAAEVTITRTGAESAEAFVDDRRVQQILDNLLSNAVKYSPGGGRVHTWCEVQGHTVAISVTDTGIGIPAPEQEQLFARYFRASTALDRGIEGTGLGLANARAFAEAHGGDLHCSSEPGVGSTFTLVLPDGLEPSDSERAEAPPA